MTKVNRGHLGVGNGGNHLIGERRAMNGDEPRGARDEAGHRPVVEEVRVKSRHRQLSDVGVRLRVVRGKLSPVIVGAQRPKESGRPRMVQMRVVQHGQAWVSEEVGPQVVMVRRVANLKDRQVIRLLLMPPHEIVRRARARRDARHCLVYEDVDLVIGRESRHEVGAARRDACRRRRHGAEPGEAGHGCILNGSGLRVQGSRFKVQKPGLRPSTLNLAP